MTGSVFYVTRLLPDYRIPVLEQLNSRLGGRLVVGYGNPPAGSSLGTLTSNQETGFTRVHLPNYWLWGETVHAQGFRRLFRSYGTPDVVLAEESPRSVTLPWLLRHAKKQGAARVLWGHFSSNNRTFSPHHPFDRYRLEMARRVEACVCYSEPIKETLAKYIDPKQLFVARNTVHTDRLFAIRDRLSKEGKDTIRKRLNLPADVPVLAFLGRLIPKKGTSMLLEVFQKLRSKRQVRLLIIGDGPERPTMEQQVTEQSIQDVQFLGAITDSEELGVYLFAADTMLIPGYLGLADNDAFAFGLPVISQEAPPDQRFHSPEIAYLEPGRNGKLAPRSNVEAMVRAVEEVLDDQQYYSENALIYARQNLTLDRMVEALVDAVEFAALTYR